MAVFCATGLVGAWITVLLWLPRLMAPVPSPLAAAERLARWRRACPRIDDHPWMAGVVLALLLGGSLVVIWQGRANDDITRLQSSSQALLQEDSAVQSLLGNGSSAVFLLVTGDSLEQVLEREERLRPRLQMLVEGKRLEGYAALSQVLPSRQRQLENVRQVQRLYDEQWPAMAKLLALDEQQRQQAQAIFERGSSAILTPEKWQQLDVAKGWSQFLISDEAGNAASVVVLKGAVSTLVKKALENLVAELPGVFVVDRIGQINRLMATYRGEILHWLLIAYTLVALILGLRYRRACWRVLLPPLLASVLTFAGFLLFHQGYNLFNLVALMLVLGIGLDMGVFLRESGNSDYTWLAVSLSALSSLLAFGLLALSRTPVLYDFGIIILPGLLLTWCFALFMGRFSEGEVTDG